MSKQRRVVLLILTFCRGIVSYEVVAGQTHITLLETCEISINL